MGMVLVVGVLQRSDTLPDIVLLDVTVDPRRVDCAMFVTVTDSTRWRGQMPLMSGIEVCAKLRATYSRCRLPIIMVCAKAAEGNIVEGLEAGATDYVEPSSSFGSAVAWRPSCSCVPETERRR